MEQKFKAGDKVRTKNNRMELIVKYYDEICGHNQTTQYVRCSNVDGNRYYSEGSYCENDLEFTEPLPTQPKFKKYDLVQRIGDIKVYIIKEVNKTISGYAYMCSPNNSFEGRDSAIFYENELGLYVAKHIKEIPTKSILQEAEDIVNGGRQEQYPTPVKNFRDISVMASLMTGKELTPEDCVKVLIAVKLMREVHNPKYDNKLDIAGYTYILNKIIESNNNE